MADCSDRTWAPPASSSKRRPQTLLAATLWFAAGHTAWLATPHLGPLRPTGSEARRASSGGARPLKLHVQVCSRLCPRRTPPVMVHDVGYGRCQHPLAAIAGEAQRAGRRTDAVSPALPTDWQLRSVVMVVRRECLHSCKPAADMSTVQDDEGEPMNIRKSLATVGAAGALTLTSLAVATPAQAAPVLTGGLVNVTIIDAVDISRVNVQLPIAVAANVCDVDVNVLAADLADDGTANCTATADSRANNR